MSEELLEVLAVATQTNATKPAIVVEQPVYSPGHEMAVPEQYHHADAVFAQHDREASAVAGWIGMWAGTLLLKDIIKDTVTESADEREKQLRADHKDCDCC
jgi:hypothetical protein